jgi:peptidoglycan/LPS O-acetylase OafA/YrhL
MTSTTTERSLPPDPSEATPNLAPPPGHPRFPHIDALRAIAALSIVALHSRGSFADGTRLVAYWSNLAWGVGIFFVISGFLLYRPFSAAGAGQAPQVTARDFYRRRVLRIVPGYWLALTVLGLVGWANGLFGPDTWHYYGLVQAFSADTFKGGLLVTWSLSIECMLYLLLPVYVWTSSRIRARVPGGSWRGDLASVAITWCCVVVVLTIVAGAASAPLITVLASTSMFLLGMALAVLSVGRAESARLDGLFESVARRPAACWLAAAVVFVAVGAGFGAGTRTSYLLEGATATLLVLPAVAGRLRRGVVERALRNRLLAWLGLISYGIYLWHAVLLFHLRGAGEHQATATAVLSTLLAWALTLAAATASYYLLEAPVMRAGRRRRRDAGDRDRDRAERSPALPAEEHL